MICLKRKIFLVFEYILQVKKKNSTILKVQSIIFGVFWLFLNRISFTFFFWGGGNIDQKILYLFHNWYDIS